VLCIAQCSLSARLVELVRCGLRLTAVLCIAHRVQPVSQIGGISEVRAEADGSVVHCTQSTACQPDWWN